MNDILPYDTSKSLPEFSTNPCSPARRGGHVRYSGFLEFKFSHSRSYSTRCAIIAGILTVMALPESEMLSRCSSHRYHFKVYWSDVSVKEIMNIFFRNLIES